MKKSILGLVCLILAMSCDAPQSVTVKGKPELRMSLGSPFSKLEEGERLEDYISTAKIREMMGDQEDIAIYDYQPPGSSSDIQTYIVHYPLVEVQYDVTEYVTNAFSDTERVQPYPIPNVTSFPGTFYLTGNGPSTDPGTPLFKIPLADMSKQVISVDGTAFGIELDYSLAFENNLRLRIPAFGIDYTQPGIKDGDKLRFVNSAKTEFLPPTDLPLGELEIYVQVLGVCSGTIDPQPVFEWTKAFVKISGKDGTKEGQYKIENSLGEFLGAGTQIKEAKGYIYAHGIDDNTTIMLKEVGGAELVTEGTLLVQKPRISFADPFTTDLAQQQHSITGSSYIYLTDLLNKPNSSTLEYAITASAMEIRNDGDQMTGDKITIDLVILLPLEFKITSPSSSTSQAAVGYVKLDMGKVFPEPKGNDDLFGRKGKKDDLFSNINEVTVLVDKFQNTVTGNPLSVLVESTGTTEIGIPFSRRIDLGTDGAKETIASNALPYPFTPKFEILLKKDTNENFATFKIRRKDPNNPPIFDFFLTVEAKTDLNVKL